MSVLKSKDNKELIVTCDCGCGDGFHISIDKDDTDEVYSYYSYINSNWYRDQSGAFGSIGSKLKKIIRIIRNKDYYYSEVVMTKDDWEQFKEWVNKQ